MTYVWTRRFAADAERKFSEIGFAHYGKRAQSLLFLLSAWERLASRETIREGEGGSLGAAIVLMQGPTGDLAQLNGVLKELKPSVLLGVLQFARAFSGRWEERVELEIPEMWATDTRGAIVRLPSVRVSSMSEADGLLRNRLSIPADRRVPLLTD